MSIIWFLIILAALIIVHEFGHFIVAKATGMRVDEFGLGFPPRATRLAKKGETEYTLNWLPIGGFVKIFGEDYDKENEHEIPESDRGRRFTDKPRHQQALVLAAGVTFNMVFAWLLISLGFMIGLPTPIDYETEQNISNPRLVVSSVAPESPAAASGLQTGDSITGVSVDGDSPKQLTSTAVSSFIRAHPDTPLTVEVARGAQQHTFTLEAEDGVVEDRQAIGITMSMIGTLQLPPHQALVKGFETTGDLTRRTAVGLGGFVYRAFAGTADYSNVAGPVGIVGLVDDASTLGYIYLLQFTAFISINLAIINLLPIPALDGGRLLFVAIESIKRSPINPKVANAVNAAGFALLIILMIAVTYNDILRLLS